MYLGRIFSKYYNCT